MFVLIIGWGYQPERTQARASLFFYTLFASMPLLCLVLFLLGDEVTTLRQLTLTGLRSSHNILLSMCLFLARARAFLVKLPIFTAHL